VTARHLQELCVKIGTKWWPMLSSLEQMGYLLANAGAILLGAMHRGCFPFSQVVGHLSNLRQLRVVFKEMLSIIFSTAQVSVRKREERKEEKRKGKKGKKEEKRKGRRKIGGL
jgi:hypothetical protein